MKTSEKTDTLADEPKNDKLGQNDGAIKHNHEEETSGKDILRSSVTFLLICLITFRELSVTII